MTEAERQHGFVRENAMAWAAQTAMPGEDAMAILARAQLYEDYLLPNSTGDPDHVRIKARKALGDFAQFRSNSLGRENLPLFQRCLAFFRSF